MLLGPGRLGDGDMIRIDDLTVAYDRRPAVHHLSGAFAAGSLTAVIGPNGAGKSTLVKCIAGLLEPAEGRIDRGALGVDEIAYLPQQATIDRSFPISVIDTVLIGHWRVARIFGAISGTLRRRAREALKAVQLAGFEERLIGTLSAGQFQRVLFARMLVQDARLILLDEPFNAIDARTTADLIAVVRAWHDQARTVIAVLHDLEQVRAHFPQTLYLAREPIAWGPTSRVLSATNQLRARQMAEAWAHDPVVCARGAA
jgi:zinc/manganese transport system ATP-binding protein